VRERPILFPGDKALNQRAYHLAAQKGEKGGNAKKLIRSRYLLRFKKRKEKYLMSFSSETPSIEGEKGQTFNMQVQKIGLLYTRPRKKNRPELIHDWLKEG